MKKIILLSISLMTSTLQVWAMEVPKKGVHPLQATFAKYRDDVQDALKSADGKLLEYDHVKSLRDGYVSEENLYKYEQKISTQLFIINEVEKKLSNFVNQYIIQSLEPDAQKLYLNRATELFDKIATTKQKLTSTLQEIKAKEEEARTERETR